MIWSTGISTKQAAALLALGLAACTMDPGNPEAELGTSSQEVITGHRYRIRPQHSSKCVDIEGASTYNDARAIQWDCWVIGATNNNQAFHAAVQSDGTWTFEAMHSGKCLTVNGIDNGSRLIQHDCTNGYSQRFTLEYLPDATYVIHTTVPGAGRRCVDVPGYGTWNGTPLDLWDCGYGSNQRFYMEDTLW